MENLKTILETKRDENSSGVNNEMKMYIVSNMLKIVNDYEEGKISSSQYKRLLKLLKHTINSKIKRVNETALSNTGLNQILDDAINHID